MTWEVHRMCSKDITTCCCLHQWGGPRLLHLVVGATQRDQCSHGNWLYIEDAGPSTCRTISQNCEQAKCIHVIATNTTMASKTQ